MINKICSIPSVTKLCNTRQVSFRSSGLQEDTFTRTNNNFEQTYNSAKQRIMQAIIDTNAEHSFVISEDGRILDENQGTEHSCKMDARKVEPNSILMHGHPKPLPLSSGDIACLLATEAKSQEAITSDGRYSRLTKKNPNIPQLPYVKMYPQLEKALCLKALDRLGIDYKFNKHDLANMFKDYLNYQCGANPEDISDEEALAEMPKYGLNVDDKNLEQTQKLLEDMMWWQIMHNPQKYDKEHNTIIDNYALVNEFLDSDEGFETRVEFVKEVAQQYDLEYESNL